MVLSRYVVGFPSRSTGSRDAVLSVIALGNRGSSSCAAIPRRRFGEISRSAEKFLDFESFPGHQILLTFQSTETLLSDDFESSIDSILRAHYR